jgi:hypothetical protein
MKTVPTLQNKVIGVKKKIDAIRYVEIVAGWIPECCGVRLVNKVARRKRVLPSERKLVRGAHEAGDRV